MGSVSIIVSVNRFNEGILSESNVSGNAKLLFLYIAFI